MTLRTRFGQRYPTFAFGKSCALPRRKGILLEELTCQKAEQVLRPETIVVIPVGAESKEHGPHLKLKNDWLLAEGMRWVQIEIRDETVHAEAGALSYLQGDIRIEAKPPSPVSALKSAMAASRSWWRIQGLAKVYCWKRTAPRT